MQRRRTSRRTIDKTTGRALPARAKVAFYLCFIIGLYLACRLYAVQVVHGPAYASEARKQQLQSVEIFARRGSILDREGAVLVRSAPAQSIYAVPTEVTDIPVVAGKLAAILGRKASDIETALRTRTQFLWIARKVTPEQAQLVRRANVQGVAVIEEETGIRKAPSGHLASTVLGFVGMDENGLDGIEYQFDKLLRGTPGKMTAESDQFGRAIPMGRSIVEPAKPGRFVQLTIDSYLQFETERALREQVRAYHARSGTAIVMDPHTGEILALANAPDFDPVHFAAFSADARRDRAVMDAYEPGSTFKLITVAAALESKRVARNATFPARDQLEVGGHVIHNAEDGFLAGGNGRESMEDIIAYSHNVGAAEIGLAVGKRALIEQIERFGFGIPTSIELPGENPGIVPPLSEWSASTLPTVAFGHGIAVTPLALVRAYAAIANGGTLLRPRIISKLLDANGHVVYAYPTEIERRAISPATAAVLRGYLRSVVVRGTGNPTAQVPGYTTAGKTGTAQVVENGRYAGGEYIASFVGYIPAERPRYVILIKVERPRGAIYGSVVAAPAFAKIARAAMLHAGMMPAGPPRRARLVKSAGGPKSAT